MSNGDEVDLGSMSWRRVVTEIEARFAASEVGLPGLSARRIAEEASGLSGVELELSLDSRVSNRMMAHVESMVARRLQHEPLQYVVGSWGFRTLDVMVDNRVLIPRPETEEVAGWAIAEIDRLNDLPEFSDSVIQAADLGTGSGVIGLSLVAERPNVEVTLTDLVADSLTVARFNSAGLGRPASRVVGIELGSWFEALPPSLAGRLGLIVSNPPYVGAADPLPDEVSNWEPKGALVAPEQGFAHVRHLISQSPYWLHSRGSLVVEMAPSQISAALELAEQHFAEVEGLVDQFGRGRAIRARRKL